MKTRSKKALFAIVAGAILMSAACEEGNETGALLDDDAAVDTTGDVSASVETAEEVPKTLIHQEVLGEGHIMEFYVTEDGGQMVHETKHIDDPSRLVVDSVEDGTSVIDIFALAAPGKEVPQALLNIQVAEQYVDDSPLNDFAAEVGTEADRISFEKSGVKVSEEYVSQADCSPDYYDDGWWEDAFISNYCREGNFRDCDGNYASITVTSRGTKWMKWLVMAADYWYGAQTQGYYYYNYVTRQCPLGIPIACRGQAHIGWGEIWNFRISPRNIDGVVFTNSKNNTYKAHVEGNAPCPRAHYAMMYN